MPKTLKGFKSHLPTKNCLQCGRPFQYRRKWRDSWDEVQFCSKKCRAEHKRKSSR